ncbi:IS110 family transposase [Streptomyces hydrogenans]|uniref:IS110 family transposase n=1 Tax=Streptomyces hydrogenans TaxID=1873719 RepID=UPI001CFDC5CB
MSGITTPTTRGPASSPHPLTSPFHPPAQDERGSLRCTPGQGEPFVWFSHPGVPGVVEKALPLVASSDWPPGAPRRLGCQLGIANDRSVGNRQRGRPSGGPAHPTARRHDGRDLGRYRRGQDHHHCVAIDEGGRGAVAARRQRRAELLELLTDVLALGDEVTWGIDLADGGAALAIGILLQPRPAGALHLRPRHPPASESYRGEGKTDAKDAAIIAEPDPHPPRSAPLAPQR